LEAWSPWGLQLSTYPRRVRAAPAAPAATAAAAAAEGLHEPLTECFKHSLTDLSSDNVQEAKESFDKSKILDLLLAARSDKRNQEQQQEEE
jgi:hypothetical protein